ncbi:response regulator [Desulfobacula sp.]|uniref:response regulator n=1 Tax=Desulfobacula sp. TaxID=2593537 RepID=UPI002616D1AF|nr:response regulator [Desulfobacula sp.]
MVSAFTMLVFNHLILDIMDQQPKKSPQIMFVDDDDHVRDSLKVFFDSTQMKILIFKSASEGLNSLKYQKIDMVISDYFLPDMNGVEFLNQVAIGNPDIIRILMATIVNDELKLDILKAGIDRFIEKPLTVASLDTIINELKS